MLFAELAQVVERVRATRSRLKKTEILREALVPLSGDELRCAIYFLCGELPDGKIGVGPSIVSWLWKQDFTEPESGSGRPLIEVSRALATLKSESGSGSLSRKKGALLDLLSGESPLGREFLLRILGGDLRQGALAGVLEQAIGQASGVEEKLLRRAITLLGSLPEAGVLAFEAGDGGLRGVRMETFRPLAPMLAAPTSGVEEALSTHCKSFWELKLDGARIQTHREGQKVRVYTRSLREVTASVPEVVEHALTLDCRRCILDGEVLSLTEGGRPLPFQETMRRFGRKSAEVASVKEQPLTPFYFDLLLRDQAEYLDQPFSLRREELGRLVGERVVEGRLAETPEQAGEFYEQALEAGHEGVMVKSLEGSYEAGKRGSNWLKLKPHHTLDLVVLACEWGSGRRRGWLSNLHLGALDEHGRWVMLGKTFKGLTDEMLEWQTKRYLELETKREEYVVFLKPEVVVEIAFNDIQESPHYPGGMALRFARVKRFREDKRPEEASRFEEVRDLFERAREGDK